MRNDVDWVCTHIHSSIVCAADNTVIFGELTSEENLARAWEAWEAERSVSSLCTYFHSSIDDKLRQ